jgi:DNA-binding transcriptional MerR regulator
MMVAKPYEIVLCRQQPKQLTLDTVAAHTGLHPALIERFVELGLIEPVEWQGATLLFDVAAVPRLRTISRLRESLGINVAGIAVIMDLLDRFCALQRANESLHSRL